MGVLQWGLSMSRRGGASQVAVVALMMVGGALAFLGCGKSATDKTLAVVNGQVIAERDVETRLAKLTPTYRQALKGDRRRLLEEMVLELLLLQEARTRGLERDPQVVALLQEARKQILIGRLIEQEGRERIQVTDQEIAEYYEQNKAQFTQPERWRASHILVNTEPEAKTVMDRLGRGEPFEQVAGEVSMDPSKKRGGDIGYFTRGQLVPEFEDACVQLRVGQTSGVVKSPLGYHIIQLADHQPAQQRSVADVQEQITQEIRGKQERARVDQFVSGLRKKAQVFLRDDAALPAQAPPAPSGQETSAPAARSNDHP